VGHNLVFIAEDDPGVDDQTMLDRSLRVDGVLLTADKDFGDLVFLSAHVALRLLLIRLAGLGSDVSGG